jgi:hypothetical protein
LTQLIGNKTPNQLSHGGKIKVLNILVNSKYNLNHSEALFFGLRTVGLILAKNLSQNNFFMQA